MAVTGCAVLPCGDSLAARTLRGHSYSFFIGRLALADRPIFVYFSGAVSCAFRVHFARHIWHLYAIFGIFAPNLALFEGVEKLTENTKKPLNRAGLRYVERSF